jgi:hypothetical protein
MKLMDVINEIVPTKHFKDRYNERFLENEYLNVILRHDKSGNFSRIGTIVIPQNVVDEVEHLMKYITNPSLNLSEQNLFGVVLYRFNMPKLFNEITFFPKVFIKDVIKKLISKEFSIYFEDPKTKSTGQYIIAILKGSLIITTYYSYKNDETTVRESIRKKFPKYADAIVYVPNPENIDFYDDDVVTNNF